MLEAKLTIECPALEALAAAIARFNLPAPAQVTVQPPVFTPTAAPAATPQSAPMAPVQTHMPPVGPMAPAPVQMPVAPVAPVGGTAPFVQTPPMTPATPTAPAATAYPSNPAPAPVPFAPSVTAAPTAPAPSFTAEHVGTAGADMIRDNPAKMPELLALLQQFGVPAISELKPEQLGPFATALRGLGAKI